MKNVRRQQQSVVDTSELTITLVKTSVGTIKPLDAESTDGAERARAQTQKYRSQRRLARCIQAETLTAQNPKYDQRHKQPIERRNQSIERHKLLDHLNIDNDVDENSPLGVASQNDC